MSEMTIGLIGLIALVLLFSTGIEIGFGMAVIGFLGFSYLVSFSAAVNMVPKDILDAFSNYNLTVVPLFMFMGQIAVNSGIANKVYDCAHKILGRLPGGLAMATVGGATLFKAVCGSSPATSATFASLAVPEMDKYGYSKKLSTGVVATVGTLGFLIPPSAALILLGIITEQSIGKLFMAGLIPGLILAVFFVLVIYFWCKLDPSVAPRSQGFSWKEKVATLPEVVWPILIFIVIIGGLMRGFFTPTEAGSMGTFAVLVLVFVRKQLTFDGLKKAVADTIILNAMIFVLIAGSTIFSHFLAVSQIPLAVSDCIAGLRLILPRWSVMVIILLIYLLGGSFIDDLSFMFVATPILYPAVIKLGYDPIWFDIMIGLTLGVGVVIPPMAICVFIVKNITKVSLGVIYKGVYPFLAAFVALGILLFLFPQIALYLPSVLFKY